MARTLIRFGGPETGLISVQEPLAEVFDRLAVARQERAEPHASQPEGFGWAKLTAGGRPVYVDPFNVAYLASVD